MPVLAVVLALAVAPVLAGPARRGLYQIDHAQRAGRRRAQIVQVDE